MNLYRISAIFSALICANIANLEAQWTQLNSSIGATAFAFSGSSLYAASNSGVFYSFDNGVNWTQSSNAWKNTASPSSLAILGTNLFVGLTFTGIPDQSCIFRSTDNGASWVPAGFKQNNHALPYCFALVCSGTNLFAGTEQGMFVSADSGTSWALIGLSSGLRLDFVASSGKYIVASGGSYILRSTDEGVSWTDARYPTSDAQAIAISDSNIFMAGIRQIYRSTTYGESWIVLNLPESYSTVTTLLAYGKKLFAGTTRGVFLSTDKGASWSAASSGLTKLSVNTLALSASNLFAGISGSGVWRRSLNDWMSLAAPTNGTGGIISPATFKWNFNPQALAYAIQVSADPGFTNLLINEYTADTSFATSKLQPSTVYFWRVRAENSSWASEWAVAQFTTKLNQSPQLVNPTQGSTIVSTSPTLMWTSLVSTATYAVQLSLQPSFDVIQFSKDTTSTALISPQLQRSTTYYWRVRAQTVGDTTAWSSVNSFTTVPNAPNSISLVYPDSGKQDTYQNDWFTWRADTNAISYLIQISQGPLFTSVYDSATVRSTGYRSRNKVFTAGSTYFWRVRGANIGGDGPFSSVWSFKVGNIYREVPVTSYSISSVAFGTVNVGQYRDTLVTIGNTGNDTLKITSILSLNAAFSVRPTNRSVPPGYSFADTIRYAPSVFGTTSGTILIASNALTSPDTLNVSGMGLIVPSAPKILDYGSFGRSIRLLISMPSSQPDWDGVEIERSIGVSGSFAEIARLPKGITLYADTTITVSGSYGYRARAFNAAGYSPYSNVFHVSVNTFIQEISDAAPAFYALKQNYPNPFNPSTTFSYSIPRSVFVSLRIFNTLGQEIQSLVCELKEPGYYQAMWNASNVPSGIYLYRLQAGEFIDTRRMILLK